MMKSVNVRVPIAELLRYAEQSGLVAAEDLVFVQNQLLSLFDVAEPCSAEQLPAACRPLPAILSDLCDAAFAAGIIEGDTVAYRDLFDTRVMGLLTPLPSAVIARFSSLYTEGPEAATDYFYRLCRASNYIRTDRVARDMKWTVPSEYGEIDITVNLSKPEKDPKAIAAARNLPASGYPICPLCHENEGYAGSLARPARQNLRQIPFDIAGARWYLQYSPYVYYNEHCIALSSVHTPMKIDRGTFEKLLSFVTTFPHYFIGSNADLPIVGGSILAHDHMQGGRYTFAMERAEIARPVVFRGYEQIRAGIVKWPMSVIRLRGTDREALVDLADKILRVYRGYSDEDAFLFAETDGAPHNTITPIARRRKGKNGETGANGEYELDLVLRNNITTPEHPLGVYHPHAEHHNIKKENIGLIEVMGLAVLPARLKGEIAAMKSAILAGRAFSDSPETAKHEAWFAAFRDRYTFTEENTDAILKAEIGKTFVRVLRDAGVYKDDEKGRAAFLKFIEKVNNS